MKSEAVHLESLRQTYVAHKVGESYGFSFGDIIFTGDSGYALSPFLKNPVANPITSSEEHYNTSHHRTTVYVSYDYMRHSMLKSRFRCIDVSGGNFL